MQFSYTWSDAAPDPSAEPAIQLEERRVGAGAPLVMLHGEDGLLFSAAFLDALGATFAVHAPSHPGWGASLRPPHLSTIDDLSYVYLDYLEHTFDNPVPLVGCSVGAWLGADIAVKSESRVSALVLVAPLGIKISDRLTRDFLDIYATGASVVDRALYGTGPRPDLGALDAADFEYLAAAQESMARFCWKPYLYDPKLRWRLHRVSVPTLIIWGDQDGLVLNPGEYYGAYAEAIGHNASVVAMAGVGHRLEEQAPDQLATTICEFIAEHASIGPQSVTTGGSTQR